jgi:light-regulated signal transduction histidine kinase (bacteriophytochrome)
MAGMIAGLLNISQIVRAEIRLEKIDISALVRSIFKEYMMTQPDREVELSIQEGLFAEADAKLIQIALVNLIGNAWKFTGKLDKAHIEFGKTETAGTEEFFLRDNGAGFDMKNAPNVFTVFRRLHADSEFKGTGVGLATVRRIIKRHGGEIRAEAEVNKGATFYFTLS